MDCNHFRRAVLADPQLIRLGHESPELRAHRTSCPACHDFAERLRRFELRLERALRVEVPAAAGGASRGFGTGTGAGPGADFGARETDAPSAVVVPFGRKRARPAAARPRLLRNGWRALAASVLVAVVVAGALWVSAPGSSLAADVVTHMAGEPQAWRVTDVAVPDPALEGVLRESHLRLGAGAGMVSYANSCSFRGHVVPHLVIQTGSGPVTVMVLVHESVAKTVPFEEEGYRGMIIPVPGHGSLAVLTRTPQMDAHALDQIAARVEESIVWTG